MYGWCENKRVKKRAKKKITHKYVIYYFDN